ncbi:hypothetical protein RAS1_20680 [Phycisphaerae bacterium RAS1]|nr:hypothetical protein RAS1_20680 [Phycisphaerae bacterium RAS1]
MKTRMAEGNWRSARRQGSPREPGELAAGASPTRVSRPAFSLAVAIAACLAGCRTPMPPPQNVAEALERINGNLAGLTAPLYCKALVSTRFRDEAGADHRFLGYEARLIFARPRTLQFDVQSLAGTVAQFGSDGDRYWIWIEPEVNKLWWGAWDRLDPCGTPRIDVPPDRLLDALMLRPLAGAEADPARPLLRLERDDYRLIYIRTTDAGDPCGIREIRLDAYKPGLPVEIVDRDPDGRVLMRAALGNYAAVEQSSALTPREYVVVWPASGAELRLSVTRALLRPELPPNFCMFPARWGGQVESLDESTSGADRGDALPAVRELPQ